MRGARQASPRREATPLFTPALRGFSARELAGTAAPLDAPARAFMEPRFGHDFSRIRIEDKWRAVNEAPRAPGAERALLPVGVQREMIQRTPIGQIPSANRSHEATPSDPAAPAAASPDEPWAKTRVRIQSLVTGKNCRVTIGNNNVQGPVDAWIGRLTVGSGTTVSAGRAKNPAPPPASPEPGGVTVNVTVGSVTTGNQSAVRIGNLTLGAPDANKINSTNVETGEVRIADDGMIAIGNVDRAV